LAICISFAACIDELSFSDVGLFGIRSSDSRKYKVRHLVPIGSCLAISGSMEASNTKILKRYFPAKEDTQQQKSFCGSHKKKPILLFYLLSKQTVLLPAGTQPWQLEI
jgi:hypothetical protein